MSSVCTSDTAYLELCKNFAERARHAKLTFDISCNLDDDPDDVFDQTIPNNFCYEFSTGVRSDSELMWAMEEEVLYVSNGKIVSKDDAEASTCYVKECSGRVYLKPNGIAYKVIEHNIQHGSMYSTYQELQCRNYMRDECKIAGASKSLSDIYNDAVVM